MDLQTFLQKNFLADSADEQLSEAEKQELIQRAGEAVLTNVATTISERLPEEQQQEFSRIFGEETTEEEKLAFLETHVPDFEEVLLAEIIRMRAEAFQRMEEQ